MRGTAEQEMLFDAPRSYPYQPDVRNTHLSEENRSPIAADSYCLPAGRGGSMASGNAAGEMPVAGLNDGAEMPKATSLNHTEYDETLASKTTQGRHHVHLQTARVLRMLTALAAICTLAAVSIGYQYWQSCCSWACSPV